MTRRLSLLAFIGFALAGAVVLPAQESDQTLSPEVMQAAKAVFPKQLRFTGEPPSSKRSPANPDTCAAVFSTNADGTPDHVIAVYSGKGVEVAMLAYQQGEAHNINAFTNREFFFDGNYCAISIINLANPANTSSLLAKTIHVSFNEGQDWFFIWDGKKLRNITALNYEWGPKDVPNTAIYGALIVDIDHSGAMQIVGTNGDGDKFPDDDEIMSTGTMTLFRYNGTTYASAKTLLYLNEYEPNLPKSHEELAEYELGTAQWVNAINMHQTPVSSYQLTIVNGDRDGSNQVTSAKVEINGVTIVSPAEVNKGVKTLTRTIQLQKENRIKVTVDGPAKSHIYVMIE